MGACRIGESSVGRASVTAFAALAAVTAAAYADRPARPYLVRAGSEYQRACFEPCRCNIDRRDRLEGGFTLTRSLATPDAAEFAVSGVRLLAPLWGEVHTGNGTFQRSDAGGVQASRMELDLQRDDLSFEHWDSGLVRPPLDVGGAWPVISITLTYNQFECHDTVFGLVASRVADWDVSGQLSVGDVFAFLGDYFAGSADVDGDGASTATDVFAFLTDYLTPE